MRTHLGLTVATLMLCLGCKGFDAGAREHFATAYSCPDARVEVTPRSDQKWSDLLLGANSSDAAPADVKQDPERLAKWRSDQAQDRTALDKIDVFEVSGCDHHAMLGCWHPRDSRDGAILLGQVVCAEAPTLTEP